MFACVFHDINGPTHGQTLKILWYFLNEMCMVIHQPDCHGKRQFEKALFERGWEKVPNWECMFVHRKQGLFLSEMCGLHQHGWKEAENGSHVEEIEEKMRMLTNPHHFLTMSIWDVLSVYANRMKQLLNSMRRCLSHEFSAGPTEKSMGWENFHAQTVAWSYDMEGHAQKCVERYCELANMKVEQLHKVSSPCLDDHHVRQKEIESVGELSEVCS